VPGDGSRALRVVFFGTPAFSVPTLDALLRSRHQIAAVVTQPDRPRGRGHRTNDGPVKARARAAGLTVLQPDRLKDAEFGAMFDRLGADLGVVAAYGRILPESLIRAPRLGMINVHASLLPRYRGAAPVQRAVIAGERETGVTIMRIVAALDAGPMLAAVKRPIGPSETSDEVERDLALVGAQLMASVVDRLATEPCEGEPQDEASATYAPRLTKAEGLIDWAAPAEQIHNLVRGLYPWPHAYTFLRGQRHILLRSAPAPDPPGKAPAGTIVEAAGDRFVVAAGEGSVGILQLQIEGRRPVSAREFLAGHRLEPGERFSSGP
jgi:methionyl-tRNA formyltransferase